MRKTTTLLIASFALMACQRSDSSADTTMGEDSADLLADSDNSPFAVVRDAENRELGILAFSEESGGIRVTGKLTGLPPGERAIHIHTVGQCEAPFTSAGPHWNPEGKQHGKDNPQGSHFGDMLNITVDDDGSVEIDETTPNGSFGGDMGLFDADGASIVIHAGPDDYKTDPAGNAGDRIACGVIVASS